MRPVPFIKLAASVAGPMLAVMMMLPTAAVVTSTEAVAKGNSCGGPFIHRTPIAQGANGLEVIHKFDSRPGNPAIAPNGRMFMSMHPFDGPTFNVVEIKKDGTTVPFPNENWASAPDNPVDGEGTSAVIGIWASPDCKLYFLDMGSATSASKLVGWNLKTNKLDSVYYLPPEVLKDNSLNQDFALDTKRMQLYIADMTRGGLTDASTPAIVVVDLKTGHARRLLESHPSFLDDGETTFVNGTPFALDGVPILPGLNPIAIDPHNEWLYYGAIAGRKVYRIKSRHLANSSLSPAQLASKVEEYGPKSHSDGIAVDIKGNVYITNLEDNAIGVTSKGSFTELVRDDENIDWPDGVAFSPDGYLYVTINQLHLGAALHGGVEMGTGKNLMVRVRPLAPGLKGRRRHGHH